MGTYEYAYSMPRLEETARIFRKLGMTYEELASKDSTMGKQFAYMADVLDDCCGIDVEEVLLKPAHIREIKRNFSLHGVKISNITAIDRKGHHKEIIISAKMIRKNSMTAKEMAKILSRFFEYNFKSSEANHNIIDKTDKKFVFIQEPRFRVLYGVAHTNKDDEEVSGDNYMISSLDCGQDVLALVDGMGAGLTASLQSETVVELMEQFMEAGFSEKVAIDMINTAFANSESAEAPVTIDMCVIDRFLGVVNCVKLGAVSTFIRREGWVEVIQSTTLPIGVLTNVDFDSIQKKLYEGDYIVMISDGILDNMPFANKEQSMMNIISTIDIYQPQAMAERILEIALEYNDNIAKDDMTVMVAGISYYA